MSTEHMVATAPALTDKACRNCGTSLSGHFCSACGQPDKPLDPSLHELVHEFVHEFLHLDGKILATLKALVFSPGRLSAEFLAGRRGRYIGPVRVYLTFSLLFFLVAAYTPDRAQIQIGEGATKSGQQNVQVELHADGALKGPLGRAVSKAAANSENLEHVFLSNMSKVMFAIVPLFALALRIAYNNRDKRYPAYVYFSLHCHAFAFLALTLLSLTSLTHWSWLESAVEYAVLAGLPLYLLMALRRVFGGSWRNTVFRMAALGVFYLPCFIVGLGVAGLITLMTL